MVTELFVCRPGNKLKNKIFLLAGDHRLADFTISKDPDLQQQRTMFGLRWILRELCKEHNIDLVIMDMGPGISRVNKMLLHTADIVMPSFRPDYYAWGSYGHLALDGKTFVSTPHLIGIKVLSCEAVATVFCIDVFAGWMQIRRSKPSPFVFIIFSDMSKCGRE